MKLYVLSDLHLEFSTFEPFKTDADVVVLAGDIGKGTSGIEWARSAFPGKEIVYVPGTSSMAHNAPKRWMQCGLRQKKVACICSITTMS